MNFIKNKIIIIKGGNEILRKNNFVRLILSSIENKAKDNIEYPSNVRVKTIFSLKTLSPIKSSLIEPNNSGTSYPANFVFDNLTKMLSNPAKSSET